MAASRGPLRTLTSALLLAGSALGLYNVYGENADVRLAAERAACGGKECAARFARESRSPLAQKFSFELTGGRDGAPRGGSVDVECQRTFYLIGAYSCLAVGAPAH